MINISETALLLAHEIASTWCSSVYLRMSTLFNDRYVLCLLMTKLLVSSEAHPVTLLRMGLSPRENGFATSRCARFPVQRIPARYEGALDL